MLKLTRNKGGDMMSWFNYIGLIIVILLLVPNIIYAIKIKEELKYQNKVLNNLENIGRYGSMFFMVFNIPYTWMQFYFNYAKYVYIGVNALLVIAYLVIYLIMWKKNNIVKSMLLSVIPSLIFVFSGVMIGSIPLILFGLLFSVTHIFISVKSAKLSDDSPKIKKNALITTLGVALSILLIPFIVLGTLGGYASSSYKKLNNMSVEEMINYNIEKEGVSISIATIANGELTLDYYQKGSDNLEEKTYEICSISKTFVGLIFAKSVSEGLVNLDDSIGKYLDLDNEKYYPTIRRLLTHTSGYKGYYFETEMIKNRYEQKTCNDFYSISRDKILSRIKKVKLINKDYPFQYSNFGVAVLGLVLEAIYQDDFTNIMNNFIRSELGMNNTRVEVSEGERGSFIWKENDGYLPAGAISSTISDMATYLKIYLDSLLPYSDLALTSLKTFETTSSELDKFNLRTDEMAYSWVIDSKNNIIWHNGGTPTYNSYIGFSRDLTKGVVILANFGSNEQIPVTLIGPKMLINMMGVN